MVNERIRALRLAVDLTQAQLAERVIGEDGQPMRRTDVVRLESGALKATKSSTRRALGTAFGMSLDVIDDYLDGRLSLADALAKRAEKAA